MRSSLAARRQSILALILSPTILPVLIKARSRTDYITTFLMSNHDPANQKIACCGFTQTVNHVFSC
jgi:hypothetical protein